MNIKPKQVGLVVLVAVMTLALLFGVQFGWKKYILESSVTSRLNSIDGVKEIQLNAGNENSMLGITLQAVPNFKQTALQLAKAAGGGKIIITDNRSAELQAILEKLRFNIEEGISQGDYTQMQDSVAAAAKEGKLDRYGLYLDADNIYLQLHKGDNFLYQVFPRKQGNSEQIISKE